jgi:hypothetical protein
MKAEHRKELETNTLADKMGHMMHRVQGSPRRAFFIYLLLAVVVSVGIWYFYRSMILGQQTRSKEWADFYDGAPSVLMDLQKKEGEPVSKAARMQFYWQFYWERGVKSIGLNPRQTIGMMNELSDRYRELAKDCKDDPTFEPEALLMLAVVEETKAIQDRSHLDQAVELYEDLVTRSEKKYKDTAYGKFAQDRLDHLKDPKKRAEEANLYSELQKTFNVPPPGLFKKDQRAPKGEMPPDHP